MARRAAQPIEQLREQIIQAAEAILREEGLRGLTARAIAKQINYSAGTLYNAFSSLDDIVIAVEGRMLSSLAAHLESVPMEGTPEDRVQRLAEAYLLFTHENANLWNLLFEHRPPAGECAPPDHAEKLSLLMGMLESVLAEYLGRDPDETHKPARALWAGVHGITSLSASDKLTNVTDTPANVLVRDLVSNYLAGLRAAQ